MTDRFVSERARRLAALGDPARLAIVDALYESDRSPLQLQDRTGVRSNLLAYHLDVLERAGLITRRESAGDRRRRYVRLRLDVLGELLPRAPFIPGPALFICTHNSARSQLAAALWRRVTSAEAESAGTHPAPRVHPGAVAAARRAGLDLAAAHPRSLADLRDWPEIVITVCDRAREELDPGPSWLHWSVPDPVPVGTPAAFDAATVDLHTRIAALVREPA